MKKKLFLTEKIKKGKSYRGTVFPPICGTLSALSWNVYMTSSGTHFEQEVWGGGLK